MAYRWLGVLMLSAACVLGCGNDGSGGPRGDGGTGGGTGGTAGAGGTGMPLCMTSLLCRSCPTEGFCETNDDCSIGSVCIESGCDDLDGAPITQCVFAGGGACTSDAMCTPFGRVCRDVPEEGMRCVKITPGCDTRYDCVPGFACENGTCVDRRVPCDLDEHCPKNHLCGGTAVSNFCRRIQQECVLEFDCVGLATRCEDIDGDGNKECAGSYDPNASSPDACVNSECSDPGARVCEAASVGSTTACGQYGLCVDNADCAAGFSCVGLWPDGRKECVPSGGSCSSFADCPVRQVCASARDGGAPSCEAGYQP